MNRHLITLTAALLAAGLTATLALADRDDDGDSAHVVGLWGDVPYSEAQESAGVPNLIQDMNRAGLAFSVHVGDIKAGSSRCDDVVYARFEGFLEALRTPAIYTPGDNEWTDCDRPAAGGYDSEERLRFIRENLFDTQRSFGRREMRLSVQEEPHVESRRWQLGGVTYATLHVVGSDNNCEGDTTAPDPGECRPRETATIEWMRETFVQAKRNRAVAVMLFTQANPGWDANDPNRAPVRDPRTLAPTTDGYFETVSALRQETTAFRRPVAVVQGDSHYARIDKPLLDERGHRLENFTRVETFGDAPLNGNNEAQWIKVTVDPRSREVFSYQPQIVPGNRTAVPAP
jgi:hypothetical protein